MEVYEILAATVPAESSPAGPIPEAETIRRTADEVLSRPAYSLDGSGELGHSLSALLIRILLSILRAIMHVFEALHAISPILAWLLTAVLTISLMLLVVHIILTLVAALRGNRTARRALESTTRRKLDPAELARRATDAANHGDYITGVRLLFRACLALLEEVEGKPFRAGSTNREHLNRFRLTPFYELLARFVSVIDLKWYGHESCLPADFGDCREAYDRICSLAINGDDAQHS